MIRMPSSALKLPGSPYWAFPYGGIEVFTKILLAEHAPALQVPLNTRAVPLVRKDDAHQGRVSFLPKFEGLAGGGTA
jgi:hypothetical protein